MSDAAPGRVLRLALVAWGLGELAMGRRYVGTSWLLAEAIGLAVVGLSTYLLADTTWYLVPYLAGMTFIAVWAVQAVASYRGAQRQQRGATPAALTRSPAAAAAWLTIPLLMWGTGYWLLAADAASPAAILDRFVTGWPQIANSSQDAVLAQDPAALSGAAATAVARLEQLCAAGELPEDCADAPENLLRDIRFRIQDDGGSAVATAELVRFERRPATFLGVFVASDLVPVPVEEILRLELSARSAALGSERWIIVNAA